MKKILIIIFLVPLFLILIAYGATAGFLWWSETTLQVEPVNESIHARSTKRHKITLIDDGLFSLKKRLEIIDNATQSLDLEFFIYEVDSASQLITKKLIEAAERGVKIRLLVDFSAPVFALKPIYAKHMMSKNIEVKYYNTSHNLRIVSVQHRSHRKLLIADSNIAMTGGRNIGDDYFNLSQHYNFLDSDIVVEGEIVATIKKSFDLYWSSNYAEQPETDDTDLEDITDFFSDNPRVLTISQDMASTQLNEGILYKSGLCNDIEFITDFPGVSLENRQVFLHLAAALREAEFEILGESPYFVMRPDGINLLKEFSKKSVQQNYLTNSLNSTDAFYTVSALLNSVGQLREAGVNLNVYNGASPTEFESTSIGVSEKWGTHSKRATTDGKNILIGTYNVDPRSANLNSEILIICRDSPELAKHMAASIKARLTQSWPLVENGKSYSSNLIKDAEFGQIFKFVIALPLAELFKFLL